MDQAFAFIGRIAEWIGQWIPRWQILDTTEGAINYRGYLLPRSFRLAVARFFRREGFDGEMRVTVCEAGVHFYWPARTTFVPYPTARQTDRLETQTMESKDGKTFIVSGTLTYRVDDLALLIPVVHSAPTSTIDIAMTAIHDICCDMDWADLQNEQRRGTLKTKLRNAAQRDLAELGIKVLILKLNSLARCRVFKVSQSTASEEN